MATQRLSQISGLNLYINPINRNGGEMVKAVNITSDFYGSKKKRPGYTTFLGTADGSVVNSLWSFYKNDGTQFWLYRASGSIIYSSAQGTGAWTVTGNGTISPGATVGAAVLDNTMIVGDAVGSTRWTTTGTSFSDGTLAPPSNQFEQYQNRIYAAGTASDLFYSTTGDATNWNTSGTSDSSSFKIPGAGKILSIFKNNDRLVATKMGGEMYRWDGYSLLDMATDLGPSSHKSLSQVEGYYFWLNRLGIFGYGGARPELISNPIQRQIYNSSGSAIAGGVFSTAPASVHRYDYLLGVGTITDDYTRETITNAVVKYDFNKNEFLNWSLGDNPTAMHSYKDANGNQQLIFAGTNGQCYKIDETSYTDNGVAIQAQMMFSVDAGTLELDKRWNWLWLFFNPGCQATVQVACTDSFSPKEIRYIDIGDVSEGIVRYKFPSGSRSKILFIRIHESSKTSPFAFYGLSYDADVIPL